MKIHCPVYKDLHAPTRISTETQWQNQFIYKPVDKLVGFDHYYFMKVLKVGAFEAKTHLSQLLDEVEKGALVKISRRGKPLAVLRRDDILSAQVGLRAVSNLRSFCQTKIPINEVVALYEDGRER